MSTTVFGQQLREGEAKNLYNRFSEFKQTLDEEAKQLFPAAICFSVNELQEFLWTAQRLLDAEGILPEERGIAIFFGKHSSEPNKTYLRNKVTTVLVASRVTGDEDGRIIAIDCCVTKQGEFPEPAGTPGDLSYDAGSCGP